MFPLAGVPFPAPFHSSYRPLICWLLADCVAYSQKETIGLLSKKWYNGKSRIIPDAARHAGATPTTGKAWYSHEKKSEAERAVENLHAGFPVSGINASVGGSGGLFSGSAGGVFADLLFGFLLWNDSLFNVL